MSTMNYKSKSEMYVKPTIVKINFTICETDKDVKVAVSKLRDAISKSKKTIMLKNSLKSGSFEQTQISVIKKYKTVNTIGPDNKTTTREQIFDCYAASTIFSFILENGDTIVDDFTDILNMTIELQTKCNYVFDITNEERSEYKLKLISEAIDKGVNAVNTIILNVNEADLSKATLVNIVTDPNAAKDFDGVMYRKASAASNTDTYEEIITQDMIIDMFNNKKIYLFTEVLLNFNIDSSRAI